MRFTSIRRCHRRRTKRHVCRNRRRTRVVVTADRPTAVARVVVLLQLFDIGLIGAGQQQIDAVVIVAVLRCAVDQTLAQLFMRQPFEIIRQRGCQLLLTDCGLFKD
ncbi:hypothetical protein D3C78_1177570 [compost metagenome]